MSPEPVDLHEPRLVDADTAHRPRGRWATRPRLVPDSAAPGGVTDDWDPDALFQWVTSHGPTEPDRDGPWAVLGLTPDATWLEVVRRHRELVKRHHPDLLADAGVEVQAAAGRRRAELTQAFDELAEHYHRQRQSR